MTLTHSIWFYVFSLSGFVLALVVTVFDDDPLPQAARRLITALLIAIGFSLSMFGATTFAATTDKPVTTSVPVYDMCNDPAYQGTFWWYAWGCWLN